MNCQSAEERSCGFLVGGGRNRGANTEYGECAGGYFVGVGLLLISLLQNSWVGGGKVVEEAGGIGRT